MTRSTPRIPLRRKARVALLSFVVLSLASPGLIAAEAKEEKKPLRVLAAPEREPRIFERREKLEMETVAFLGVETGPVSPTLSVQLGLARGTGLVVHHVLPKSPADGVLKEHDILLQLDDQILIETRQFSVLIQGHKENDEVTLTYLRGGKKATARVKLGKTEAPKFGSQTEPSSRFEYALAGPMGPEAGRAEADRILSMIQRSRSGEPTRIQIDRNAGPGVRAMAINTGNSNLVFSDNEGTLEISSKDGVKSLVATDPKGQQLFSGPVTTPAEREALPPGLRARLEKLEGMHDVTFRTDGDFRGAGVRVMRPRGISMPGTPGQPEARPIPAPPHF